MRIPHTTTILRADRAPLRVEVEVLSLDDISSAAALCCDGPANFRAMQLCSKLGRTKGMPYAVYVIGPHDMPLCKVGIGNDPASRLMQLQIGNWHKLSVQALVWSDLGPGRIEQLTHKAAREMGINVRGEWINAEPLEACELVLKAARFAQAPVYDSATWMDNWSKRAHAVAVSKGRLGAIERPLTIGRSPG